MSDFRPTFTPEIKEEQRKVEADQREREQAHIEDFREVLRLPAGRRIVRTILDMTGCMDSVFTGNSKTFYNSGRADVGLEVMRDIAIADPKALMQIMGEGLRRSVKYEKYREENLNE